MRAKWTAIGLTAVTIALLCVVALRTDVGAQSAGQAAIRVSDGGVIPKDWGTLVMTSAPYPRGGNGMVFQAADGTIRIVRLQGGREVMVFRRN
jgi:hypothetical protein